MQAPAVPTVADTKKGTPAPAVSGAGTEITLYAAGTQMGGKTSCRELIIGRLSNWIEVIFRELLIIISLVNV